MGRLVYTGGLLREIAFPLGGIGTGTISLGGRGQLRDFEVAGRPAKGQAPFHNFFALGITDDGSGVPKARVLERQFFPPFTGSRGRGLPVNLAPGLPRFPEVEFTGEYPMAHLEFVDETFPVCVSLDAFNPMVPGNADDSGLPAAVFTWTLVNQSDCPVKALLVAVVSNLVGYLPSPWPGDPPWEGGQLVNRAVREVGFQGITMGSERDGGQHPSAGTMAIVTSWPDATLQTRWPEQDWQYSLRPFWYQLLGYVPFEEIDTVTEASPIEGLTLDRRPEATIGMQIALEPGETVAIPVVLTWHFPNRYVQLLDMATRRIAGIRWVGNTYTTQFEDAVAVARYVVAERGRLEAGTREFHRHLYSTTVPDAVIDAVGANMSTIRTQTCFRDALGHFYGYEGCHADAGCCPMNCTHVWMYEQALASLYPALERDMRENSFLVETEDDGRMYFRTRTPRDAEPFLAEAPTAADGQMAEVIRLLREYQLSGDREFLARLWPKAKLALEYAWRLGGWDADHDGVMEGEQHNTTDIEYYGPNPLMTFIYVVALQAGAVIAREMGDSAAADAYEALAARGAQRADEILWNGEFYQQRLDLAPSEVVAAAHDQGPTCGATCGCGAGQTSNAASSRVGAPYNQVQDGCLVDQLLGLWFANLVGLGSLVAADRIRAALRAIYHYNFQRMSDVPTNFLRAFAVNDERGVVYVSFPKEPGGIVPLTAVLRAHEVWSGFEYQVACHMIQEGLIAEGQAIVEAVRARHDGSARNPWNEPECGDHYARAMASYGLLQAYAGSHFDLARGRISISPQVNRQDFSTFFAVEGAWGSLRFREDLLEIELGAGELTVREFVVDGRPIHLATEVVVTPGQPLHVPVG